MLLSRIVLSNFRNFSQQVFDIDPTLTVIVGQNARGKTNLLEGVYFSINGVGFRESKEEELMQWNMPQTVIQTLWTEGDNQLQFQILLREKEESVEKKFYVNKTEKRHRQYLEFVPKAVLFAPEHIEIIDQGPDKRREYFNRLLSILDLDYKKRLYNYEAALRKRNKLLEYYKDEAVLRQELSFWDDYLIEHATYITAKRKAYIAFLNAHNTIHERVFHIQHVSNELSKERFAKYYDKEKIVRKTMIGPQKDDFQITLTSDHNKNIHLYGSRSEQRMAVFWLKLNEIDMFEEVFDKKPVLLLDDVFSEFDTRNKKLILDLIGEYQTIITTTEVEISELTALHKSLIKF